jgi:hypothetical protein
MKSLISLFILLVVATTTLDAQQRITMGQTIQGTLDSGSLKLDDGSYYNLIRYDSPGNETIVILYQSSDFDAYLMLGTLNDGAFESIASDDDGGGGTDSRIEHTLTDAGTYYIRANTLGADETGSYTLSLQRDGASAPVTATRTSTGSIRNLPIGETISEELTAENEMLQDSSYAQRYRVQLVNGQQVQITLQGDDFDAYLMLLDDEGTIVAKDDDSAGGTDARIDYTATKTGPHIIIVNSLGKQEEGAFALFVEHISGPQAATEPETSPEINIRPINIGQVVSGELTNSSPKLDDGTYYDVYTFTGVPNTTVNIMLMSEEFDAYLLLSSFSDQELTQLETDDDSGGGTDSKITYRIPDSGIYVIRVNTLSEGETGSYMLSLTSTSAEPVATSPVGTISIGQTISGSLNSFSPKMDDDSYFHSYAIVGVPNTTITITYKSDAFDAYLLFGTFTNNTFTSIETDDDGAGGTDSQIIYTFTDSRTYMIRANTLSAGSTGDYTLTVTRN